MYAHLKNAGELWNDFLKNNKNNYGRENQRTFYGNGKFGYYDSSYGRNAEHVITFADRIDRALKIAIERFDFEAMDKFNGYNKKYSETMGSGEFLSDKDIQLIRMKSEGASDNDMLVFKHTHDGIIDVKRLFSEITSGLEPTPETKIAIESGRGMPEEYKYTKESLKCVTKLLKTVYTEYIIGGYIHYLEFATDLINKGDFKALFRFAVDHELFGLEYYALTRDKKQVEDGAYRYLNHKNGDIPFAKVNNFAGFYTDYDYFHNPIPLQIPKDGFIEFCNERKRSLYDEVAKPLLMQLDAIKEQEQFQITEREYEKLCNKLNEEHFKELIDKEDYEKCAIDLCKRLEATLKHKYKMTGELKEMLDEFCPKHFYETTFCDGEDCYTVPDEETAKLLAHLRMFRNSAVHSDGNDVTLSESELISCMDIILKL